MIGFASAVQIDPGTLIQSNGLNLTFNFTAQAFADSFSAETNAIYFNNYRRTGSEYITMNITLRNLSRQGVDLPYFSSSTFTSKIIASNLSQTINGSVTISINCANAERIVYTSNTGLFVNTFDDSDFTCAGDVVTLTLTGIEQGVNNVITITENGDTCSSVQGSMNSFGDFFPIIVLAIVAAVILVIIMSLDASAVGQLVGGVLGVAEAGIVLIMMLIILGGFC